VVVVDADAPAGSDGDGDSDTLGDGDAVEVRELVGDTGAEADTEADADVDADTVPDADTVTLGLLLSVTLADTDDETLTVAVTELEAETLLEDLSDLFRHALVDQGDSVTLDEEITLAQRYLAILQSHQNLWRSANYLKIPKIIIEHVWRGIERS
jgi:hypothetical protein